MAPISTLDLSDDFALGIPKIKDSIQKPAGTDVVPIAEANIWNLSENEIEEIERALHHFQGSGTDLNLISAKSFPLPSMSTRLRNSSAILLGSEGHLMLRGLRPSHYQPIENVIIFLGLASYIGDKRAMTGAEDNSRSVLQHITQIPTLDSQVPPHLANQNKHIPMHTDRGDIVSLYTMACSLQGGRFHLGDINKTFPKILSLRPDLADVLSKDWSLMNPSDSSDIINRPLIYVSGSKIEINFSYIFITGSEAHPRPSSLPAITADQHEALAFLQKVALQDAIPIDFRPGDILFFNNRRMMHARDAFVDNAEVGRKRHLLRLTLKGVEWPEVPNPLRQIWNQMFNHEDQEEVVELRPELFTRSMGP